MNARLVTLILGLVVLFFVPPLCAVQSASPSPTMPMVEPATLGKTNNIHRVGSLYLAGQFEEADIDSLKQANIGLVITLRKPEELKWDEQNAVESAGLQWTEIPFRDPNEMTDEVFNQTRKLLRDSEQKPTLLHCATANRVGGVWLAYRVLDQHTDWETALAEAKTIGLKNDAYTARAKAYIDAQTPTQAGPVDINKDFLDPNLNVDQWIARFEVESREIFSQRLEILKHCEVKPGFEVADIGAGTGLFTRLLAHEVQDNGNVYAVEISTAFLNHINQMAKQLNLTNLTSVLCREDSVGLPKESIDLAFVCDTYHHFAYPEKTLQSIFKSLRPGGLLVIVDFERIPGQSREWVLNHVRAGKDVVRGEVEAAGFEFVDEPRVAGLHENYLMRFRRR